MGTRSGKSFAGGMDVNVKEGMRILVGDDDRVNRLVIQGMLKRLGYDCVVVDSGKAVIDAVKSDPFDYIFLDVQFPDMDGFEVAEHLETLTDLDPKPKIAFVSGHDAGDFREKLSELGIEFFITKPVTVEALRAVIDSASQP